MHATAAPAGSSLAGRPAMVRFRLRTQLHEWELPLGTTVVGRGHDCTLYFDDDMLSREHAEIHVSDDRVTIRDLGSRNGTFVNGIRITEETELRHGDRIRLGLTEAVFGRAVTPRRDLATTAGFRSCRHCRRAFVSQAPSCPHCGEPVIDSTVHGPRSESQARRDFWLSLEIALLEKAMSLHRLDEAAQCLARVEEKLAQLLAERKSIHAGRLQEALCAAVRLARARGSGREIGWALDVLGRIARVPGPELFALIAATPPIVLEQALPSLERFVAGLARNTDLSEADTSCFRSMAALVEDVRAFQRRRSDAGRASHA